MEKAREYHQAIYVCFINLKVCTIQSIVTLSGVFFSICYQLPEKLLTSTRALHEDSTSAVRTYGKTSEKFPVMYSVC